MRARTPHAWGLMRADQRVPVKKSRGLTWRKNSTVSKARTAMMPSVVRTPRAAARNSSRSMIRSPMGRRWVRVMGAADIRQKVLAAC